MPLSIEKLKEFLHSKGFHVVSYFTMEGTCFYIEIFSKKHGENFLLYIPSKYTFSIKSKDSNTFKLKFINMSFPDNIADEYAGGLNIDDMNDLYKNVNSELNPAQGEMEGHLENNYKYDISLRDITQDDIRDLKAIYRQVKRLKFCVQSLPYKLGIIYKNYLCSVRRDNSINSFVIKNYSRKDVKKFLIIVNLETLYEKGEKVIEEINTIRESIYKILEKNQITHSDIITRFLENKKNIISFPKSVQQKKQEYDYLLYRANEFLAVLSVVEGKLAKDFEKLKKAGTSMQDDAVIAHQKLKLETELMKIIEGKRELIMLINTLREKKENSILNLDKINFDNAVMFDSMIKNFSLLKSFA